MSHEVNHRMQECTHRTKSWMRVDNRDGDCDIRPKLNSCKTQDSIISIMVKIIAIS